MLAELGAIVDDLYGTVAKGGVLRQHIVFLVGNGIDPVNNILNDRKLRAKKGARKKSPEEFEAFKWRHFEYARYYSASTLPSFAHCCISKLVESGICREVITTNYDLFFDTLWQRLKHLNVSRNPVAKKDEYLWDDYYSPELSATNSPRYWKVHGSLSHVCFRSQTKPEKHHLYRLPSFAISFNNDKLARSYRISTQAPFMGYEIECYPKTGFLNYTDLEASFSPYIDWTFDNNRDRYSREINAAKQILERPSKLAAVVLLGFSGFFDETNPSEPWNEELVPVIRNLLSKGFKNVFMAVHEKQYELKDKPSYCLMRDLASKSKCHQYSVAGDFMAELLSSYSHKFPITYAENDYRKWRRWYLTTPEAQHV